MREIVDRRQTERGEIQLQRQGGAVYEIIYNGIFLMASYNDYSERILARTVLERLPPKVGGYQILIGGLGMGFTLQEVLSWPQVSRTVVIEIEKAVVDWNRSHLAQLNGDALKDPRTVVIQCDLFDFLYQVSEQFDAVLIDVDNGPNWLALEKNKRLYSSKTLRRIKSVLTSDGVFATWSAQRDNAYLEKLSTLFDRAEEISVEEASPPLGESLIYVGMTGS
ncbi:MAG: spermine/spermidine synthase [Proteobacteria bacterium]|nr:spermine/spermidine synthase [Pseudomonadota bacterium]